MFSTRQARARLIRRLRGRSGEEMNLVPMIDIFTVLVTFLLMTAVFYRTVILELNLPTAQNVDTPPPALQLEIVVRKSTVQVADRGSGLLSEFKSGADGYDYVGLSEYLKRVKERFPEKLDATILLEPDISYDTLVQMMDTVRVVEQKEGERTVMAELFPEISIGDAPL